MELNDNEKLLMEMGKRERFWNHHVPVILTGFLIAGIINANK